MSERERYWEWQQSFRDKHGLPPAPAEAWDGRARIAEQRESELAEALRNARSVTRAIGIAVRDELPSMASDAAHCANQIDALLAKHES